MTSILDQKHPIWKYLKAQLPANQMLKDKIKKKNSIIQKEPKQKIAIKRMRIKVKIKK
jgi:hypothetical protein